MDTKFLMNGVGLKVIGEPTKREWISFGKDFRRQYFAIRFAIGDWANYGVEHFGVDARELAAQLGVTVGVLGTYRACAKSVPSDIRNSRLSFTHHLAVMHLNTGAQQELWLEKAIKGGWTAEQLTDKIRGRKVVTINTPYGITADCSNEKLFEQVTCFLTDIGVEWESYTMRTFKTQGQGAA